LVGEKTDRLILKLSRQNTQTTALVLKWIATG
jgi:hypothetical protein